MRLSGAAGHAVGGAWQNGAHPLAHRKAGSTSSEAHQNIRLNLFRGCLQVSWCREKKGRYARHLIGRRRVGCNTSSTPKCRYFVAEHIPRHDSRICIRQCADSGDGGIRCRSHGWTRTAGSGDAPHMETGRRVRSRRWRKGPGKAIRVHGLPEGGHRAEKQHGQEGDSFHKDPRFQ